MVVVVVVVDVGVAVSVAFRRAVRTGLSMPMKIAFKNTELCTMSSLHKVNEL